IVPAVRGDDDFVFAAKETPLATWVAALEELGPVDMVEPGPLALARALARVQVTGAVVLLDRQADGIGVVEIREGRVTRARRVLGLAVAVAVAALVFAVASADAWRARATRGLEASLQSLKQRAAPALSLQNQLQALDREAQAIRQVEQKRPDPLGVLLALSKQLPAGAYLRGIRW